MRCPPSPSANAGRAPAPPPTPKTTVPWRTAPPSTAPRGPGAGSQAGGMVQERPGQIEAGVQVGGEGFDPDRLGGVVACVEHVHPELFGVEERMMRSLAGDEGVEPRGRHLPD